MTRIHGLVLSLLLTAAAVLGAYATMSTAHIGAASRPRAATAAELRARSVRLDKWSKSLDRALGSKPPALPALPQYGRVGLPAASAAAALARVRPGTARTPASSARTTRVDASARPRVASVPHVRVSDGPTDLEKPRVDKEPSPEAPSPTTAPPAPQPAPQSAPEPVPAPAAPSPAPTTGTTTAPAASGSVGASVEDQCDALERAAQGKGDAAERAAEQQCDALKHPGTSAGTTGTPGTTHSGGTGTTGSSSSGSDHPDDD